MSRLMGDLDLTMPRGDFSEPTAHADNLRKALEAALGVIDAMDNYGDTFDPDYEITKIDAARSNLESTLSPFRRKGGGV